MPGKGVDEEEYVAWRVVGKGEECIVVDRGEVGFEVEWVRMVDADLVRSIPSPPVPIVDLLLAEAGRFAVESGVGRTSIAGGGRPLRDPDVSLSLPAPAISEQLSQSLVGDGVPAVGVDLVDDAGEQVDRREGSQTIFSQVMNFPPARLVMTRRWFRQTSSWMVIGRSGSSSSWGWGSASRSTNGRSRPGPER